MLRAGLIGFGRMGITHFSILNTHPSVEIVAVCDQSHTMLNILRKYMELKTYTDYLKMLKEEALDFVVISTPPDSHTEIIRAAIDNNLHTFVEKPFALAVAEGRDTIARLENKTLVNQVGYVNRFNEVFEEVKKLLDAGVVGEVKNFRFEMHGAIVLKDSKASWRGKKKSGGGCLYEFASHCIDLVVYFLGQPDRPMGSVMQSIYSSDVEDLVSSTFTYVNGCNGTISVNWSDESYRKPTFCLKFFGTRGKIQADQHAYKLFLKEANKTNGFRKGWNTRYITDFSKSVRFYIRGNEFTRQLDYFVESIEQGRSGNTSSFAEALKTDVMMEEIVKDSVRVMEEEKKESKTSMIFKSNSKWPSIWRKFRISGRRANA